MDIPMLYHRSAEINLKTNSDELIARAQAGDDEAFGLIFERHHRFIYKFIYAMTGEREVAEELTQETFFRAYKGIQSLRGEAKLQTWLCAIAKNLAFKSYRSTRKEGIDSESESLALVSENDLPPDREFLSKELNRAIYAALEKLDRDKRLVFTLKELQNLSYKEISEITGHAIPKLKTDLHRAKNEMRNELRHFMEARK